MDINIAGFVSPAFDEVFYDIMSHGHTYYWMKGGRGSTKSSFVSLMIPILMLRHPECHVVVIRKVGIPSKDPYTHRFYGLFVSWD